MSTSKNKITAGDVDGGTSSILGSEGRQAADGMSVTSKKAAMGKGARERKFKKESTIYGIPSKNVLSKS